MGSTVEKEKEIKKEDNMRINLGKGENRGEKWRKIKKVLVRRIKREIEENIVENEKGQSGRKN